MLFRHGESRILSVNCSNLALVRGEEMTAQVNLVDLRRQHRREL